MNTVTRIENLNNQIKDALKTCLSSKKKRELNAALESISSGVEETVAWLKADQKGKYIPVRKALISVANVATGLHAGLSSNEIGLPDFRASIKVLNDKFIVKVDAAIAHEIEAAESLVPPVVLTAKQEKIKISLSNSPEAKKAVQVINTALKERESVHKGAGEISSLKDTITLDAMSKMRDSLPIKLIGEFQLVRMPVIPIFSNQVLNSEATFKKIGLKFYPIEGYGILLDQMLLLVSSSASKKKGIQPLEFAQSVVSMLNERGSVDYALVSDSPTSNPRNTDLHMFWVMPLTRMNAFMKVVTSSRTPTTMKWGLPF